MRDKHWGMLLYEYHPSTSSRQAAQSPLKVSFWIMTLGDNLKGESCHIAAMSLTVRDDTKYCLKSVSDDTKCCLKCDLGIRNCQYRFNVKQIRLSCLRAQIFLKQMVELMKDDSSCKVTASLKDKGFPLVVVTCSIQLDFRNPINDQSLFGL